MRLAHRIIIALALVPLLALQADYTVRRFMGQVYRRSAIVVFERGDRQQAIQLLRTAADWNGKDYMTLLALKNAGNRIDKSK